MFSNCYKNQGWCMSTSHLLAVQLKEAEKLGGSTFMDLVRNWTLNRLGPKNAQMASNVVA